MRKRKFLFYLPGIIILVILLVYLVFIIVRNEVKQDFEELRESNSTLPEESELNLDFYETIDEAAIHGDLGEYNVTSIKEKVKLIQDDKHAILFFINNEKNFDTFIVYKFNIKTKNSKTFYSEPTHATGFSWGSHKGVCKSLKFFYEDTYLTEIVKLDLKQTNARQSFNLNPDNTHFYWGLHFDSRVMNMEVNGISPTEVIPVTLDGEQAYFWYYEDLGYDLLDVNAAEPEVVFYEKGTQAGSVPAITTSISPAATPTIIPTVTPRITPTVRPTIIPTVTPTTIPPVTPTASMQDSFDVNQYDGKWYAKSYNWVVDHDNNVLYDVGSWLILDFKNMKIDITDTSYPPMSRIAEVYTSFSRDGSKGEFTFDDDGWGCSGTGTVEFNMDEVIVNINVAVSGENNWGIYNGEVVYTRNKTIIVDPNESD